MAHRGIAIGGCRDLRNVMGNGRVCMSRPCACKMPAIRPVTDLGATGRWRVGVACRGMWLGVAERFSRIVGLPPIDYLLRWRMAVTKDALRRGGRRLAEIAFDCGYESASAFSTAFARTVGCPPSRYRRPHAR